MMFAAIILVAIISTIFNMMVHVKVTKNIRHSLWMARDARDRSERNVEYWREMYSFTDRRNVPQHIGRIVHTDMNDFIADRRIADVSEETARQVLSKLYHIAKTNSKEETLRGAVLNWSRKHMKTKNQGE